MITNTTIKAAPVEPVATTNKIADAAVVTAAMLALLATTIVW